MGLELLTSCSQGRLNRPQKTRFQTDIVQPCGVRLHLKRCSRSKTATRDATRTCGSPDPRCFSDQNEVSD